MTRKTANPGNANMGGQRSRRYGLGLMCAASASLALLGHCTSAHAGTWALESCSTPGGLSAPTDGWLTASIGSPGPGSGDSDSCPEGGTLSALTAGDSPQTPYWGPEWVFTAPEGSTIAGGTITATLTAASGLAWLETPNDVYDAADVIASCQYNEPCGSGGTLTGTFDISHPGGTHIYAGAACVGGYEGATTCRATGLPDSSIAIRSATIQLAEQSSPTGRNFSGGLLATPSRGSESLTFRASESAGPGIRTVTVTADSAVLYHGTPVTDGGSCNPIGESEGSPIYLGEQPCPLDAAISLPIDTSALPDGGHELKVTVADAAQNTSVVYDAPIITVNAPANTVGPTVSGSPGSKLHVSPGSWTAPSGAGAIGYSYAWQECEADGQDCRAIGSATGADYTPTESQAAGTLRVLVTASNEDGASTAASTPLRSAPDIANGVGASEQASVNLTGPRALRRAYRHRAFTLSGQLTASGGAPISNATMEISEELSGSSRSSVVGYARTNADGAFTAAVPAGPSRQIIVGYRAFSADRSYSARAIVTESVAAQVALSVTPRRTAPTGKIRLAGRIAGPIPRGGVVVELLVHYRGRWEPFRDPRTDRSGHFAITYGFQGAEGRFPFRAEVPGGQAGFPYASGVGTTVTVRTR